MSRTRAAFWDPDGDRYGIPTYWWRGAPPGYATRRQLRERGLCPGGQPVAAAVRAALAKAMRARRTCPTCWQVRPYVIPHSLGECLSCAPSEVAA